MTKAEYERIKAAVDGGQSELSACGDDRTRSEFRRYRRRLEIQAEWDSALPKKVRQKSLTMEDIDKLERTIFSQIKVAIDKHCEIPNKEAIKYGIEILKRRHPAWRENVGGDNSVKLANFLNGLDGGVDDGKSNNSDVNSCSVSLPSLSAASKEPGQ